MNTAAVPAYPYIHSPVIGMIHDTVHERFHPIVYLESPLPGPYTPDKPVRHKSKSHHTTGFATRIEAVAATQELAARVTEHMGCGEPVFCLDERFDLPWNGAETPADVAFFLQVDGKVLRVL